MSVFFLADTHFGDGNILRYENRPFATVEEMDRELIRRWNEKVGAGDTVFHLGDFSARGEEEDRAILSQLAGEKVLVLGNHDRHRTPAQWRSLGFAEAVPWPLVWEGFSCSPTSRCTSTGICPTPTCSVTSTATPPIGMPAPAACACPWSARASRPSPPGNCGSGCKTSKAYKTPFEVLV